MDTLTAATQDGLSRRSAQAERQLRTALADLRRAVVIALLIGLIVMSAIYWSVSRSIITPLTALVGTLKAVAAKNLAVSVDTSSQDEIGQMATALQQALQSFRQAMSALGETALSLNGASEKLGTVSETLEVNARNTADQAGLVAGSAGEVSSGVAAMSAATEQMSASIQEIASNASTAASVAQNAVQTSSGTAAAVQRLSDASIEIGEILRTITGIAEQTNLLALNATIEAARAGAAGKGFAVVATEVKDLAQATARATDDIARKIDAIQAPPATRPRRSPRSAP